MKIHINTAKADNPRSLIFDLALLLGDGVVVAAGRSDWLVVRLEHPLNAEQCSELVDFLENDYKVDYRIE